jgi:hypothetical protein
MEGARRELHPSIVNIPSRTPKNGEWLQARNTLHPHFSFAPEN